MDWQDRLYGKNAWLELLPAIEDGIDRLQASSAVPRLWTGDYTLWKPEPAEISNRLGWLDPLSLQPKITDLNNFAQEVILAGFRDVVLLGMGGSSLGAGVFARSFPPDEAFPKLWVLDSILPEVVCSVTAEIDIEKTLFLVASKSGGTVEVSSLYEVFWQRVYEAKGENAGQNFVAITDPETSLEALARKQGFRRTFINEPDIGGRYSVLSYFGLVPAALIGIDITRLLEQAGSMQKLCQRENPLRENPGVWLGAALGMLAELGRDKLTIITSPGITSFGDWLEQLVAESTGKEGKGILPVTGESWLGSGAYGQDRGVVYLRLEDDDNEQTDAAAKQLVEAGQPVLGIDLPDIYCLGAEFFRWEFAMAIAGAVMGINPFDQPDVKRAKTATEQVLNTYLKTGIQPALAASGSLEELLGQVSKGKYVALMAYLPQSAEVSAALNRLRQEISLKYRVATTLGYGPRYLHSTGQIHKGGRRNGLFIQITGKHEADTDIPEKPYSLGVLADAQAQGDFDTLEELGLPVIRLAYGSITRNSAGIL